MTSDTSPIAEQGVATLLDGVWAQARHRAEIIRPQAALEVVGHKARRHRCSNAWPVQAAGVGPDPPRLVRHSAVASRLNWPSAPRSLIRCGRECPSRSSRHAISTSPSCRYSKAVAKLRRADLATETVFSKIRSQPASRSASICRRCPASPLIPAHSRSAPLSVIPPPILLSDPLIKYIIGHCPAWSSNDRLTDRTRKATASLRITYVIGGSSGNAPQDLRYVKSSRPAPRQPAPPLAPLGHA